MRLNKTSMAVLATVALAGIGTGSAVAANGTTKATKAATATKTTPAEQQAALITALAGKLNITADALKTALVATAKDRVAADLKAGRITQAQADEANKRIEAGQGLLGPIGGKGMHGPRGAGLDTAATFLGLTQAELQTALQSGKTLAAVAKEKGKTSDALIAAIVAAEKAKINADTNLTDAQKTQILSGLDARVKDMVENGPPQGGKGFGGPGMGERGGRGGHGHGGFDGPGFGRGGFGPGAQAQQGATGTGA